MSPSPDAPPAPRRLEVPVLADIRGYVWAAGVLDVTLRHQGCGVLAESPPPGVAPELARAVLGSGAELARARGDAGAVTVAFAADPATGEMRLLESIPGLPPEHAVLEALTGVDLPAWQARLARGGGTDKAFLTEILDQSEIDRGGADPAWLEALIASGAHLSRRGAGAALLAAAIAVYERDAETARARFYGSAVRGRPEVPPDIGSIGDTGASAELWYRGQGYALRAACLEPGLYRIDVDGSCFEVKADPNARTGRRLACGGRGWHVSTVPQGDDFLIEVDGVPHRISGDQGSVVRAPAPAVVVSVPVREDDEVQAGDPLVILEAMKMETTVTAPAAGRVRKILVRKNSQVGTAVPLLVLDPPSFGDFRARRKCVRGTLRLPHHRAARRARPGAARTSAGRRQQPGGGLTSPSPAGPPGASEAGGAGLGQHLLWWRGLGGRRDG